MTHRAVNLVSFVLIAVYTLCSIMLISMGISVYRGVRAQNDETNTLRVSMEYVENKLRANDVAGAISLEDRDGVQTLVLKYDGGDECETLIYFLDGTLYELFKFTDAEIEPQYGTELCSLKSFEMTETDGALRFTAVAEDGETWSVSYAPACAEGGL